jgi:hypothetical protein
LELGQLRRITGDKPSFAMGDGHFDGLSHLLRKNRVAWLGLDTHPTAFEAL